MPPPPATMIFSACRVDADACIEYSWIPTGQRHTIFLRTSTAMDSSTDPAPNATHVQVYTMRNGRVGLPPEGWQFPSLVSTSAKRLVGAVVHANGDHAFGQVVYEDGTIGALSSVRLVPVPPTYGCEQK
jgi:hypothetical protein